MSQHKNGRKQFVTFLSSEKSQWAIDPWARRIKCEVQGSHPSEVQLLLPFTPSLRAPHERHSQRSRAIM
jgi:hypothetical protein